MVIWFTDMTKILNSIEELQEWIDKELIWEEDHSKADAFGFIVYKEVKSNTYWNIETWNGVYVVENGKIIATQVYPKEIKTIVWKKV